MRHITSILLILSLLFAGCSLSSVEDETDETGELTKPVTVTEATVQPDPQPTPRPLASATAQPSSSPIEDSGNVASDCVPRSDWPQLVVAAGDTTSAIARRTGTTTQALAQANCLSDPSLISVGQTLYVPRQPDSGVVTTGALTINPYLRIEGSTYIVRLNHTLTLTWVQPASGLNSVDVLLYSADGLTYRTLGTDSSPANGVTISFVVPANLNGFIIARGKDASGREVAISPKLDLRSNLQGSTIGDINVAPIISTTENGYVVAENNPIQISWGSYNGLGPGDVGVIFAEFIYWPEGSPEQPQSLGIDEDPSDGFTLNWVVPPGTRGRLGISARLPGEMHTIVEANTRYIQTGSATRLGRVDIKEILRREGDFAVLQAGASVLMSWTNNPRLNELVRVDYYSRGTGIGASPVLIASDTNTSDGIGVTWTVPAHFTGALSATGRTSSGSLIESAELFYVTSAGSSGGVDLLGMLTVSPAAQVDPTTWEAEAGAQITLRWPEAPSSDVTRIEFYMTPTGTGQIPTLIGSDNSPADGASLNWTIPTGILAHFSARAILNNGSIVETENSIRIYAE